MKNEEAERIRQRVFKGKQGLPYGAENADDLEQAINCYIQYGEYSIDELLDEIKQQYKKKED